MNKIILIMFLLVCSCKAYTSQLNDIIERQWENSEFNTNTLSKEYFNTCMESALKAEPAFQGEICEQVAMELIETTLQRAITLDQYNNMDSCSEDQDPWEDDCYPKEDKLNANLRDSIVVSLCHTEPVLVKDGNYTSLIKRGMSIYDDTSAVFDCDKQWFVEGRKHGGFLTYPQELYLNSYQHVLENLEASIQNDFKDEFLKQINRVNESQIGLLGHRLLNVALMHGDTFFVKELLSAGVNPNTSGGFFDQPLATALRYSCNDSIILLLDAGANPEIYNDQGHSSLYLAAENCPLDIINLLLDKGVDVEGQLNDLGRLTARPLAKAAEFGRRDVVERLLAAGANADYPLLRPNDYNTLSLLEYAMQGGNEYIFNELLANGATLPERSDHFLIKSAIKGGSLAILKSLFSMGVEVPTDKHGDILFSLKNDSKSRTDDVYPYRQHTQYQRAQQLGLLIDNGLSIEYREHGAFDYITRLTSIYKNPDTIDDPVRRKFNIERQALVLEAIKYYAEDGLDLNYTDNGTLLVDAVRGENLAMVELLLELGADKNIETSPGKTVRRLAGHILSKIKKDYPKWQDNRSDIEQIYFLLDGKAEDLPTIPDKPPISIENVLRQILKN